MTNEQALKYWRTKYNLAKDYWDEHWEAEERHSHQRYVEALEVAIAALEKGGAANAEPVKHGHWIGRNDGVIATYQCSNCGDSIPQNIFIIGCDFNYCPYCDAKMDGGEEDERR